MEDDRLATLEREDLVLILPTSWTSPASRTTSDPPAALDNTCRRTLPLGTSSARERPSCAALAVNGGAAAAISSDGPRFNVEGDTTSFDPVNC
jgi:hypothetical protein